jgi:tripartite ATP-independent transporter DctP family solute receptor
MIKEYAV